LDDSSGYSLEPRAVASDDARNLYVVGSVTSLSQAYYMIMNEAGAVTYVYFIGGGFSDLTDLVVPQHPQSQTYVYICG